MAKKYNKRTFVQKTPAPVLYALLGALVFFFLVCMGSPDSIKVTTIPLMLSTAVWGVVCFQRLRGRIHLPFMVMTAWVLCNALSVIYASSGKFALAEILKILLAFSLSVLLLLYDRGEEDHTGRPIAGILAVAAALASLVSIDLLSTRLISGPILGFLGLFTPGYHGLTAVEAGVRMTSIFTNPNVFAGIAGIGTMLSLGLASTEPAEHKAPRAVYLVTLYVNALAFVLAFSMGATAMIAAAFLLYLFLEKKENRASLLVLMIETFVLVLLSAALISMTSFTEWTAFRPIPLLCTVAGSALLWVAERFLHEKAAHIPSKMVVILLCSILAVLIAYGVAAVSLTGSATLEAGGRLRRAAYPAAGEYSLQVDATGPVTVTIESQNRQDTMMHTSTRLYKGDASGASYTVPEDSLVLYFNFRAPDGATVHSVSYTGVETGSVPLGYKLLPGFIANRLQGLLANQNAIQRVVFFGDGMKLFRQSPIIGLGLGSFENSLKSVQSFLYETKFVHNHYIQSLLDTGIIGLLLFVGTLAASAWALIRSLRRNPMVPALLACMLFIAGHAAVELVFSAYPYLPFAYGVLVLSNLIGGDTLPALNAKVRTGVLGAAAALFAAFSVLVGCNVAAKNIVVQEMSFDASVRAAKMDAFEWADYALSYIMSSLDYSDDAEIRAQADAFAQRIDKTVSNSAHLKMVEYYLRTGRAEQAFLAAERHVTHVASDPKAWQNVMDLFMQYDTMTDSYRAGVAHIGDLLNTWNEEHMGSITLDEKATAFLEEAAR